MFWLSTLAIGFGFCWAVPPEFEVASIKLEEPAKGLVIPVMTGGPGSSSPGRFRCSHVTLMRLITRAYDVLPDQVIGPAWLNVERYSVDALVPPDATSHEFARMLQNLLVRRFALLTAGDQREYRVYRLVIAKGGSKLRPSPQAVSGPQSAQEDGDDPPLQTGVDRNGCPQLALGSRGAIGAVGGENCMTYRRSSMPLFVQRLALMAALDTGSYDAVPSPLHIIDQTGLQGEFDFELKYAIPFHPPGSNASQEVGAAAGARQSIFQAIETQLGLKLVESKARLRVLIVKRAERTPSGN